MKKSYKVYFMFLFLLCLLCICKNVQANSISKISMDIFVDNYGTASVTEVWNCYANEGTEVYHPYYNLGNSRIQNLSISENGGLYQTLSSWNTSGTLSSKANKCGINYLSNGVELCWGISSYGSHVYTVKYNITNFVSELSDSQMIYWTLIPYDFSNEIGSVDIRIHSNFSIPDTVDVWGYGNYGGLAYVNNGSIYMQSDGKLDTDEYMTILVKFPLNTFNLSNELDYDFNHFYNMAQDGARTYRNNEIITTIMAAIPIIFGFGITLLSIVLAKNSSSSSLYGFKYGESGKKISKDVPYYRDIPLNGDLFRAYYIAYQYGIIKSKTDILGAVILKWLKEGTVRAENRESGKILKKDGTVIILTDSSDKNFTNSKEAELFNMMYEASNDGILENKEFEKWSKKHYEKIPDWFDNVLKIERENLVSANLITCEDKGFWGKKYTATSELKELAIQIAGLKRYLLDYTLIKDREAIEVQLFEDYLIYAQMLGIAKQVSKQFKELYPDMIEQTNYYSYDNIVFINMYSSRAISSANSARAAAQSYSSGGGGFSSGGGGGGSFGGRRRRRRLPLMVSVKLCTKRDGDFWCTFSKMLSLFLICSYYFILIYLYQF